MECSSIKTYRIFVDLGL